MKKIFFSIKSAAFMLVWAFMLTGCVEEYEAELPVSDTHLLVVNGTIYSNRYNQFQLSWSIPLQNKYEYQNKHEYDDYNSYYDSYYNSYRDPHNNSYISPQPVEGAKVTVCGTDGSEFECVDEGEEYGYSTGVYSCYIPELNPDVSYFLTIKYMSDVYQSVPEKPIHTPGIESMECFQKDSLSDIEILLTTEVPDDPDKTTYFTWDYFETWEVRPNRISYICFDLDLMKMRYRANEQVFPKRGWKFGHNETILTESTAHYADGRFARFRLLNIPRNDERISWYYCHDLRQRAISKAEYEYELACKQAGWEMGGLFTPQPSALPTNIRCVTSSNRAIGYIGCSQNDVSMSMYVDGTTISRILPKPGTLVKLSDCNENDCAEMEMNGMVLYGWNDGRDMKRPLETYWGYPEDFDVRLQGATVDKPYYMPPFDEWAK